MTLTHIANVAMKRLTVTNDITSWKSSLIGKTLLRCLYVYVLFYFCSKVKHAKAPLGAMVFEMLTEGKNGENAIDQRLVILPSLSVTRLSIRRASSKLWVAIIAESPD